jgi:hypothetical protein
MAPDSPAVACVGYTERVLRDVLADNLIPIAPPSPFTTSSNSPTDLE